MRSASRVLIAGFGLGLGVLGAAGSETVVCDPELESAKRTASAYRQRGDRCEGEVPLKVNSSKLHVLSLTESFEDYSLDTADDLWVEWSPPGDGAPVKLRGQSLDVSSRGSFYRMDTAVAAGRQSFRWPNQVLALLRLERGDVGVVGWIPAADREARRVYLPLRIRQGAAAARQGRYRLALVPGERLREVFVTLAPVLADGTLGPPLRDAEALGRGYYPALAPTHLEISGLPRAGLYQLDLTARLSRSGTASTSLRFYHDPD